MSMQADNSKAEFDTPHSAASVHPSMLLKFAKQFLCWVGVFCAVALTAYVYYPENQALQNIFEVMKVGVLPLITLILTFYFTKEKT